MKYVNGLFIFIGILMIAFSCAAKPDCHALDSWMEDASGDLCGMRTYQYGDFVCSIDGCNVALSDPCWRLACVDGHFDPEFWEVHQRDWRYTRWIKLVDRYGYEKFVDYKNREMHCESVERKLDMDETATASFVCCVPAVVLGNYRNIWAAGLTGKCDFSEGGPVGFVNLKK